MLGLPIKQIKTHLNRGVNKVISDHKPDLDWLAHFGVLGMKWGVRKQKDAINSHSRTIKKGTTIQNITSRQYTSVPGKHLYAAYTPYDKAKYIDLMGNFMYNERGYKNEFVIKKDIKVPSDKKLVDIFVKTLKSDPKQVAKDMSKAYNDQHLFATKSVKYFDKKVSQVVNRGDVKQGQRLAKEYISDMVSSKAVKSRSMFFGNLIKEGFDAMSDVNDRDQNSGTQDPLIIFNPSKSLGKAKSVKLTKKDLDYYSDYTTLNRKFSSQKKNFSKVQR